MSVPPKTKYIVKQASFKKQEVKRRYIFKYMPLPYLNLYLTVGGVV